MRAVRAAGGVSTITIADRAIGAGHPAYIIAEMSANHSRDFNHALRIVEAAAAAGADAIKLQTYTADTLTIACSNEYFQIRGTQWSGRTLHDLYQEAYTPWEWHAPLKEAAQRLGLHFFSTPFDSSAIDFLDSLGVPAFKIASFELVDIPLLRQVAQRGKPVIASTGMATFDEVAEAMTALRHAGAREIALLKCTSGYPAKPDEMHLRTIPDLSRAFDVPVGLSDHTLGTPVPVAAVALGASIIEKHLTLARADGGPDSAFSLEPDEFRQMVDAVRTAERALGSVHYGASPDEAASRAFRRSLFVVKDVSAGEAFTPDNVRSIRPGHGMHPRHFDEVLQCRAAQDIARGTPLAWPMIDAHSHQEEDV
jgi:pseudaminic acid synthase